MLQAIADRRADVAELCRRFRVRRLDVFGSAARGTDFEPGRSDLDLLVEYERDEPAPSLSEFLAFREALSSLLGGPVDLLVATAVRNPFVRAGIERSRESLYAA